MENVSPPGIKGGQGQSMWLKRNPQSDRGGSVSQKPGLLRNTALELNMAHGPGRQAERDLAMLTVR